MHLQLSMCAKKKKKKIKCTFFAPGGCQTVCTCKETCRGHRRHLEKREWRERAEMKPRTKAPRSAPGHCYFKRFSSKTEDGEQCGTQSTRSERCAGSSTVSSFSKAEERRGQGGKSKSAEASRGRVGVKDRNTGGDKAPHPPEALVFTAPFAPQRRCDAKKHASTWPELQGALCALCSSSSSPHHHPHTPSTRCYISGWQEGKRNKKTSKKKKREAMSSFGEEEKEK